MQVVNYLESWKKAAYYVREYNESLIVGVTKTLKPRYDLGRKLRTEHVNLVRLMIRLYSVQLRQGDVQLLLDPSELPPFETNSPALAKVLDCSPRTIRNLITRLMDSRLIVSKQSRGRKSNYRLVFSPEVLAYSRGMFPKADLERIDAQLRERNKQGIEEEIRDMRKSLPQLVASKPIKENNLRGGEKKAHTRPVRSDSSGNLSTGNPAKQDLKSPQEEFSATPKAEVTQETAKQEEAGKTPENAGEPASLPDAQQLDPRSVPSGGPGEVQDPVLDWVRFEDYYIRLLSLIQAVLYPKLEYMAESQIHAIQRYFALKFGQVEPEDYHQLYMELRTRVLIVEGYLKRKPGRYVPIPARYFDPENTRGFERTAIWYERMGKSANKRREYAVRYRTIMRTWDGFLQTLMHYLDEPDWNKYREGHKRIKNDFPGFLNVYDYVILSHLTGGRMIHPQQTNNQ